jgi:uncharacterized membrane protein
MIQTHKVIGILVNTLVMYGLTLALIQTNVDKTNKDFLALGFIMGFVGNAVLVVAYVNNTLEDE